MKKKLNLVNIKLHDFLCKNISKINRRYNLFYVLESLILALINLPKESHEEMQIVETDFSI